MKHIKSILSILLAVVLLVGSVPVVVFASSESDGLALTEVEPTIDPRLPDLFEQEDEPTEPEYAPDDVVRVAIVLEDESAIDEGYPIATIGNNKAAADYQDKLCREQEKVVDRIEKKVLDGEDLDVVTNLTLVANLVSADVEYSQIEEIENVKGVKEVVIENVYEPLEDEQTTGEKADAVEKALTEYTGAGSRIAIIDSGVNDSHQSFDADALNYSLKQSAPDTDNNGAVDENELAEYKKNLNFMTKSDVLEAVNSKRLHVLPKHQDAEELYLNDKIPFAYNYSDFSHFTQNGGAGIHGSHVSGIAAANTYIPAQSEGAEKTFVKAEDANAMVGTAPDAQILNLKVFGSVMCTDSVIAMAIEDALILGADVLNLSLGTAEVGFSCSDSIFGDVFDELSKQGVLIMGAVGNDGAWMSENKNGRPNKLYADDVNMSLCTPPSSYADFMGVAWADGNGKDGSHPTINKNSAYGIPSSLMLQPEITAYGTLINSVDGYTNNGYKELSGTSMASPDVAGAAAVVAQYLRAKQFGGDSFLNRAQNQNSKLNKGMIAGGLLMSTADPMLDKDGRYYSLLRQGAGLLNTKRATEAKSFLEIAGQSRGRVKAEVGDCPDGSNTFNYKFTLHNVSDTPISYIFKTNLFTEDIVNDGGVNYLADHTRELIGTAVYEINGKELDFSAELNADVNRDRKTDDKDAQALLDYLSGKEDGKALDLSVADVDGDNKITTYDAHLILKGLKTTSVSVAENSSVTVDVEIRVTEDLKKDYPKGTYLEGFTSVIPVQEDGEEADVTHTIPILGFCGNWSDPSMFDRNSFIESSNGTNKRVPYTQNPQDVYNINYMTYQDENGNVLKQAVNPYNSNSRVPLNKLALSINDTIRGVQLTLIRPAGALCFAIMKKDENGKRSVVHIDAVYVHQTCAYPNPDGETGWSHATVNLSVRTTLKKLLKGSDIKEGDKIELGAVAVPEYYEEMPGQAITKAQMKELIEKDMLGKGAYLTTTVTLDSEAPKVTDIKKLDLEKKLQVTADDNQNVAYIGLFSGNGTVAYENYIPDGNDAGPTVTQVFSTKSLQEGGTYNLVVGDYAGNRSMYCFTFGEPQDITDKAIAYVRSFKNGGSRINRGDWVAIKPDKFSSNTYEYTNMLAFTCADASDILAGADAADGYLWQAFEDGRLCVAPISDVNAKQFVCDLSAAGLNTVRDLAFNPNDSKLYAADGSDTLWQIDPMLGDVKRVQRVTVDGQPAALYGLAVNNEGKAFATHYDETEKKSVLLSWQITDGDGEAAAAVAQFCELKDAGSYNKSITARYISLSWKDQSRDTLYAACADNLDTPNNGNYMYKIYGFDFENKTSTVYKTNSGINYTASLLYGAVRGLVNLPAMPKLGLITEGETPAPRELNILGAKSEMVAGDTAQLTVAAVPWNAKFNASGVKWQSSNTDALTVVGNGFVTAVGEGKATIAASCETQGGDTLTAQCEVNVKAAPSIYVAALFCEGNGGYYWESFNTAAPNSRKRLSVSRGAYTVGTLNREKDSLYLFGGTWAYRVNPKDFTQVSLEASIDPSHLHADGAPGRSTGLYPEFGYMTIAEGKTLLLGSRLGGPQKGFETVSVSLSTGNANVGTMGGIAYKGFIKDFDDLNNEGQKDPGNKGKKYGADVYYVMNEGGDLYELYCYVAPRWYSPTKQYLDTELTFLKFIGHVEGVNLSGVSKMQNDATASMIYDSESSKLVLVSKIGNGVARVQVIDPEAHSVVMTREFDDDVRQVGILYQYDYKGYSGLTPTAADISGEARTYAENPNVDVNEDAKTVTYNLTEENTTNGLTTVKYDPNALTFKSLSASMPYNSYNVDSKNGTVTIAFADASEIKSPSAQITFTFEPKETEQTTELTVTEKEKGAPSADPTPNEWKETITLPAKIVERTLRSIEISKEPTKTKYIEGQDLETAGLEVTAIYSDNSRETLAERDYTVEGYVSTPGTHIITVTYQNLTADFEVTVEPKFLTAISINKNPDKMQYIEGTSFDDSGMELKLHYNNGDEDIVAEGWNLDYDFSKAGQCDVVISYKGCKTTLTVNVVSKSLVSVSVSKNPNKMEYVEGTSFDDSGMELKLHYNNGDEDIVAEGWKFDYDFSKAGQCDVVISYKECKTTLTVNVVSKSLVSVSISKNPNKMEYVEGTSFDDSGMELKLHYNNGDEDIVAEGWKFDYDFSKAGQCDVVISYKECKTTLTVNVVSKSLVSVSISKNPNKMQYIEGTSFDDSGMELKLRYDNGTTEKVTAGWTVGDYDFGTPGQKEVTITYGGKTATLTVTVTEKSLTGIKVTTPPNKQVYLEASEELDIRGGKLMLYYDNGTTEEIELSDEMITDGFDNTKPGKQTVIVTYGGFTETFEVTVQAKDIDRIEITRNPDKSDYVEGTKFDPQGMEITVYYNNGKTEVLTEGLEIAYTFDKVGMSDVMVSYQGYTAVFTVNVVAKTLPRIEVTKMPNNMVYEENAEFNGAGMEITLYYDNGTTQTVTKGWTVAYDFSVSGQREVKVNYGGVETSFTVTVKASSQSPVIPGGDKDVEDNKSPQTGDDSCWCIWLLLMMSSGSMLTLLARLASRKKHHLSD